MADNYLEKRMEDYLRGKRAAGRAKTSSQQRRTTAHIADKQLFRNKKFCIVACGAEEEGLLLASKLREMGATVAVFTDGCKMLAQFVRLGTRVYSVDSDDDSEMEIKFAAVMRYYFNPYAVCNISTRISDDRLRAVVDEYESSLPLPPANPTRLVSGPQETVLHNLEQFVKNKF